MEFVGWQIKPKEEVRVSEEEDEDILQTIHTTQVALGDNPAAGRHTIFVTTNCGRYAIGTLEKGRCEQFSIDFMAGAAEELSFSHTGSSDIFITGYKTRSVFMSDDEGMIEGDEDEEDEDEDDEEEAPNALPLRRRKLQVWS